LEDITNFSTLKTYLSLKDFHFKKNLGQNFLIDANITRKIVDSLEISEEDVILEIGPGAGALTQYLVQLASKVIAVEIDDSAIQILSDLLKDYDNLEIINKDILKTDISKMLEPYNGKNVKVVSNLPYYITTPVIMQLLEYKYPFERIITMMQKEVAQRLGAKVSTKDYSTFTISVDYYASTTILFDVPNTAFIPQPNVTSTVVRFDVRKTPPVEVKSEKYFFKTVKFGFLMRRKQLINCMTSGFGLDRDTATAVIESAGIKPTVRAEALTINELATLSDAFYDHLEK